MFFGPAFTAEKKLHVFIKKKQQSFIQKIHECSESTHLCAFTDFVPCSEVLGTVKTAGVMQPICTLLGHCFVPRCEALGIPQLGGVV